MRWQSQLNGTTVNGAKIEERCRLKHNDVIGLGCIESILMGPDENLPLKRENMYVYRLVDRTKKSLDPIEISDDEEQLQKVDEDVKPVISNGTVKKEPIEKQNGANLLTSAHQNAGLFDLFFYLYHRNHLISFHWIFFVEVASTSWAANNIPAIKSPPQIDENQDDDNEMVYSQQVLMEIKKEVSYSEEVITLDDDFTICISDDDSNHDDSFNWAGKLSQDQDLVVKKITESVQSKKRKAAKQIEAMPLAPPKKGRRNSVSSNVASTSNKTKKVEVSSKQPSTAKIDSSHTNHAATSNNASISSATHSSNVSATPAVKNTPKHYVDHLDPYAKTPQKTEKPKTFEDALLLPVVEPKKRIANRPKSNATKLVSILRKENRAWPSEMSSNGKQKKPMRRVHFSEENFVEIREYEPDDDENGEILISAPTKPMNERTAQAIQSNSFENDPLHEIITDITEWKTEWLLQRNNTPPINGVNFIVYPLMNSYRSFENYKQ